MGVGVVGFPCSHPPQGVLACPRVLVCQETGGAEAAERVAGEDGLEFQEVSRVVLAAHTIAFSHSTRSCVRVYQFCMQCKSVCAALGSLFFLAKGQYRIIYYRAAPCLFRSYYNVTCDSKARKLPAFRILTADNATTNTATQC